MIFHARRLKFALQQMAAESYFDNTDLNSLEGSHGACCAGIIERAFLRQALHASQERSKKGTGSSVLYSTIRSSTKHASDATGFSATLIRDGAIRLGKHHPAFRKREYHTRPGAIGSETAWWR